MRQLGTTTNQMLYASHRAIYIWCNTFLTYPINLAYDLGRTDLQIVSPHWLDNPNNWKGRILTGIVIDHAINDYEEFWFSNERYKNLTDALICVDKNKS